MARLRTAIFFFITTPTIHINFCAYYDTIAKDSPKVVSYDRIGL